MELKLQPGWSTKASYKSSAMPSRQDSPILAKHKSDIPFGSLQPNSTKILRSQTHTEGSRGQAAKRDIIHLEKVSGNAPFSFGEASPAEQDVTLGYHQSAQTAAGPGSVSGPARAANSESAKPNNKGPRGSVIGRPSGKLNVSMSSEAGQNGPLKSAGSIGVNQPTGSSEEILKKPGLGEDIQPQQSVNNLLRTLEVSLSDHRRRLPKLRPSWKSDSSTKDTMSESSSHRPSRSSSATSMAGGTAVSILAN